MLTRYSNVFRSRWKALIWAAGVLLTAYCSIPSKDDDQAPMSLAPPAAQAPAPAPTHNPWALDKPAAGAASPAPAR